MVDTVEAQSDLSFDDFKVVWASAPFPNGPVAYRYNLKPEIQEGIGGVHRLDYSDTKSRRCSVVPELYAGGSPSTAPRISQRIERLTLGHL